MKQHSFGHTSIRNQSSAQKASEIETLLGRLDEWLSSAQFSLEPGTFSQSNHSPGM